MGTDNKPGQGRLTRRAALGTIGAGTLSAGTFFTRSSKGATDPGWSGEADVIIVGSGAAGCSAAIAAVDHGARVMILEKMPVIGGTTSKSGGALWIPNNSFLRAAGLKDERDDCLRYLARCSYPRFYNASASNFGVPDLQFGLLEAFYDNASIAVDRLIALNAAQFRLFMMYFVNKMAPDYEDHLPENKTPRGRCIEPYSTELGPAPDKGKGFNASTALGPGELLIKQLSGWLKRRGMEIATNHRVTRLITDDSKVIGVEVTTKSETRRIRAKRGVIFASGGFAHNYEFVRRYQPGLAGSCARPSSTGDFIPIAAEVGALLGSLDTAWLLEVVLEEALDTPAIGMGVFLVPGDSMVMVNKYGRRVVNEKRSYNDRTKAHFTYDPTKEEFPNQYLFVIFDERTLDAFAGSFPLPTDKREVSYLLEGKTWAELEANLDKRLSTLRPRLGNVRLSDDFLSNLRQTIERFDKFAQHGKDVDFGRGDQDYDKDFHEVCSTPRAGTKYPKNNMPNITMHPFASAGPYYCIIVGAGALDTNSGPLINEKAEVLDARMKPIPGLYGAGNCISGPAGAGYYGGGGTIGPAVAFGYIAGKNAAARG